MKKKLRILLINRDDRLGRRESIKRKLDEVWGSHYRERYIHSVSQLGSFWR